jgi:hypothetical protein
MLQVVRDSNNPFSVVRYHSLLRDIYGTDGFQGVVSFATYAGIFDIAGSAPLGPTQGQMIDIFAELAPTMYPAPTKLERDFRDQPIIHTFPLTTGYYNGCLLTIKTGPARGQTTRIVDYKVDSANNRVGFRVMTFPRADGQSLTIDTSNNNLTDLANATFIVNGRPFNGTGVGYDALAGVAEPRLTAVEATPYYVNPDDYLGTEIALTPNSRFVDLSLVIHGAPTIPIAIPSGEPYILNDMRVPPPTVGYPNFVGPGGADESYDAADFQNMFLALQTVSPRAMGRVVTDAGIFEATDPNTTGNFLRLDIEDLPMPSFHRPDLVNYWFHRLLNASWFTTETNDVNERARIVMQPYGPDGIRDTVDDPDAALEILDQIVAFRRKIMLRPLREDHPNFDGSNPMSRPVDLTGVGLAVPPFGSNANIIVPYWEAVGPWDVDNDNDGVPDSIWVDLGDPVQQAEDGTLYKPLYAFLIMDMDGRLNVNAHGTVEHVIPPPVFDPTNSNPGNLAHDILGGTSLFTSSDQLPPGSGWGPADISLRPLFPVPAIPTLVGNRNEDRTPPFTGNGLRDAAVDGYATILVGRTTADGMGIPGRYGFIHDEAPFGWAATAGLNYRYQADTVNPGYELGQPGVAAQFKFFGYPLRADSVSAFGTPPDLKGRYAMGLGYTGQPVYEEAADIPNSLLLGSPYELDLSGDRRRDSAAENVFVYYNAAANQTETWENAGRDNPIMVGSVPGILPLDDDAPFGPYELERVLRANDADAGSLPSRLWDITDAFDPLKLLYTYWNNGVIDARSPSSLEVAFTQKQASINRRLVTTDSYDLPVPAGNMPGYVSELGADGKPGKAPYGPSPSFNGDDNGQGGPDDASEIGYSPSDDFAYVTGTPFNQATIIDLLHYRVFLDQRNKYIQSQGWQEPLNANQTQQLNGQLATIKANADTLMSQGLVQQLLAPDLIAGRKMDLNRPFGDGLDNDSTNPLSVGYGVVDDPLEAGEPYLDTNGDGRWVPGEPFIDVDGDGNFTASGDRLWTNLSSEDILFDYTNGQGNPVHPLVASSFTSPPGVTPAVHNLESQGRQLYARHLYCLMLALMDDDYIAPYDESDPQLVTWLKKVETDLAAAGVLEPKKEAQRKLSRRMIAQWAINCADARDADAIMTPFEYDENPWDGWGVTTDVTTGEILPLDGDPATDENEGRAIDWSAGIQKTVFTPMGITVPTADQQTRGVVWGAERPELLITETLAFHDRRTEDLTPRLTEKDGDLDQRLRPRGSLFVEVYNPWSPTGQLPLELYSRYDSVSGTVTPSEGVELGRLSNVADSNGKRSPVWRIIVVEEWPEYRNTDPFDDPWAGGDKGRIDREPAGPKPAAYPDNTMARLGPGELIEFQPTAPDFDPEFDPDKKVGPPSLSKGQIVFSIPYPYIEREFYFTSDDWATRDITDVANPFKLRLPDRTIKYKIPGIPSQSVMTQTFVPLDSATKKDIEIAPILPGRYGVIGSAGTKYDSTKEIYTTTVGRRRIGSTSNTSDAANYNSTRRIELRPHSDPEFQQVLVSNNGGSYNAITGPSSRDNELVQIDGNVETLVDVDPAAPPNETGLVAKYLQPAVAIPVEGMNVSEPAWGWAVREKVLADSRPPMSPHQFKPRLAYGEGMYADGSNNPAQPYFPPFDEFEEVPYDPVSGTPREVIHNELSRIGTTANYRMIHLQRLANPLLPWNPLAGQSGHDPELPVNPYRTVDSSSVNITAFNGVSDAEGNILTAVSNSAVYQKRPWVNGERTVLRNNMLKESQLWYFKSLERGVFDQLSLNPAPNVDEKPQRQLFAQERITGSNRDLAQQQGNVSQVRDGRSWSLTFEDLRREFPPTSTFLEDHGIYEHRADGVMEHSLGLGNESYGNLYVKGTTGVPDEAAGAPAADTNLKTDSTYPWLTWNNRPFSSAQELLQIPAASSEQLLKRFSTPLMGASSPANPYDGNRIDEMSGFALDNVMALRNFTAPFGHLMNFFATAATPSNMGTTAAAGDEVPVGAPHFYRLLDYVHVPSRFVGTDEMLNPEVFNDDPNFGAPSVPEDDITSPLDPRYNFQPPYNKVSRYREPGKVNLNTVTGQRLSDGVSAQIWSDVYDGIMHLVHDMEPPGQLRRLGPFWREIVLSRRGYVSFNADGSQVEDPITVNDAFAFGLNRDFPSVFTNPLRAADAGSMVPLVQMQRMDVDASMLRRAFVAPNRTYGDTGWGEPNIDDDNDMIFDELDEMELDGSNTFDYVVNQPLFQGQSDEPFYDTARNPYFAYEPMTRMANLVTTRSNVYAIWVTVGYFEVEPAPDWLTNEDNVRERFGGDSNVNSAASLRARALYDRVYPEGYTLGRELGIDTGANERQRGFYIIDRSLPVGFKPGEDLNVEDIIRVRRRIE